MSGIIGGIGRSGVVGRTVPGIKVAAQWRLSSDFTTGTGGLAVITTAWIQSTSTGYSGIGSVFTQSSGEFTFPETGIYYIDFNIVVYDNAAYQIGLIIDTTIDHDTGPTWLNSAWQYVAQSATAQSGVSLTTMFDVTDVSKCKVRFLYNSSTVVLLKANANQNYTGVKFIRLGDT